MKLRGQHSVSELLRPGARGNLTMKSCSVMLCLAVCLRACSSSPLQPFQHPQEDELDVDHRTGGVDAGPTHELVKRSPYYIFGPKLSSETAADEKNGVKSVSTKKDQNKRIKELEDVNRKLLDKIDEIEQQTKINNLIFLNVEDNNNENERSSLRKVMHIINTVMNVKTSSENISVASRMDNVKSSAGSRPILVRFTNFATKDRVLAARYRLRGTIIEVRADYTDRIIQRRKELLPYVLVKRSLGHEAFILYDKLLVDCVKVSLEELREERRREERMEEEEMQSREFTSLYRNYIDGLGIEIEEVEISPGFNDPPIQDCVYEP